MAGVVAILAACVAPASLGGSVGGGDGGGLQRRIAATTSPVLVSQSSCRSSSYARMRGRQLATASERIASSQFCSCSVSSRRAEMELEKLRHSAHLGYGKLRSRRKLESGLKQIHLSGGVPVSRARRRVHRVPKAGRENVDLGGFKLETQSGIGEGDDAAPLGDDAGELTELLAATIDAVVSEGDESSAQVEGIVPDEAATPASWKDLVSKRWSIVIMCFFAFLLCNMDRVNMSIAVMPMSAEYHWSPTIVGLVQSSFFWGYLLTQVAGGIWADSIGGKQVLGFGVIWWSLATVATPIAAKIGLPALFFVRACMGIGEGVAMPAMNNLLSKWIPVQERSRSLAFVYSGMYLGSVTGLACSPSLIQRFGWPSVFFSFGSVGTIWFAIWQSYAYSSPMEDPTLSDAERKLILKSNKPKEPITDIPWGRLLSKAPVWALIVCHFCHNWGTFILLTWMPTYYNQVLHFNLMESGLFSVLPWLTMAVSANVGGWIADTLVSKGYSVTIVRKVMQTIGFLGPAFFLTQLSHITSPHMAVLCMMASQGLDAFSQAGLYSNHQDIGPRYSGILLGLSNTAGVLAGVFGTAATGYILQHGSWDDVFKVAVGLYLFGTVVWNLFSTGEQLFD